MVRRLVLGLVCLGLLIASYYLSQPVRRKAVLSSRTNEPGQAAPSGDAMGVQAGSPTFPVRSATGATAPGEPVGSANPGQTTAMSSPPAKTPTVQPATEVEPPGDPLRDVEEVQSSIRSFRTAMGENPVGTNAEITKALLGDNANQVRSEIPNGSRLNGNGEMVDRWGTPYFFHQLSRDQMEVRSAGPDRTMWTGDDRLTR